MKACLFRVSLGGWLFSIINPCSFLCQIDLCFICKSFFPTFPRKKYIKQYSFKTTRHVHHNYIYDTQNNLQLASHKLCLLSWYPAISSHWLDMSMIHVLLVLGRIWVWEIPNHTFWYASTGYQAQLAMPLVIWQDYTTPK